MSNMNTNLGYCRMCAEIKQCFNLIVINKNEPNNADVNTNLNYKIFQCFQIKVLADDSLPKTVCFDCCTQIDHIYEFYQKVQKAQEFLSNIVFNSTINDNFQYTYNDFDTTTTTTITTNNDFNVENQNNIKFIPKVEITEGNANSINNNNKTGTKSKFSKKIVRKRTCIWTCHKCQMEFKIRNELDKHSQDVHGEPPEYKCPKCSKSYMVYRSFTRHLRLHRNQNKFGCFICHKSYSENKTLRKHLKLSHGQDLKKVCTICGIVFKRAEMLDSHLKKFHKPAQKKTRYECDICKKKVFNLLWHKKTHEAWKAYTWNCEKCQLVFQRNAELVQHCKEIHDEPPEYKCPKCARCHTKYRSFIQHLRMHRDKNRFGCNICGKAYSTNRGLRRHVYENHELSPLVKPKCPICTKVFKNPRMLQIHQKSFHTGNKVEVECDICHKKLASKASLYLHKKIHDESSKSHVCDHCGIGFRQKCTLKYHIETVHTVINKDNYLSCSLCPARFRHKRALRGHITRIHAEKRFQCDICGKKFGLRQRHTEHMRIHTGERPYECEFCKKCFRLKRQLEVHMRQHTGEKPYQCIECNHAFTNSANYIKHKRRKHGIGGSVKTSKLKDGGQTTMQRQTRGGLTQKKTKEQQQQQQQQQQNEIVDVVVQQEQDRSACMQRMLGTVYPMSSNNAVAYTSTARPPNNLVYPKPNNNIYPNMHQPY